MLMSLAQWAASHGKTPQAANKLIQRHKLPQAQKIGRNWLIDGAAEWPADRRYKK